MKYRNEIAAALETVRRASLLCRTARQRLVTVETLEKRDRSPVTIADYMSQAVINRDIRRAFPQDDILGEEDSSLLRGQPDILSTIEELTQARGIPMSRDDILDAIDQGAIPDRRPDRFWTVDPIDGTKGFLRGDQYAVALALVENGSVVLGVLGCPNLPLFPDRRGSADGCIVYAVSGQGARLRGMDGDAVDVVIQVDRLSDPSRAVFCESVERAHAAHDTHARIAEALGVTAPPCRMDSQAKYAAVARGEASVYLRMPRDTDYREKIWDHAAGAVVVSEAGGRVSDFTGRPLDFSCGKTLSNNRGVLVTNGVLHTAFLEAIGRCT